MMIISRLSASFKAVPRDNRSPSPELSSSHFLWLKRFSCLLNGVEDFVSLGGFSDPDN